MDYKEGDGPGDPPGKPDAQKQGSEDGEEDVQADLKPAFSRVQVKNALECPMGGEGKVRVTIQALKYLRIRFGVTNAGFRLGHFSRSAPIGIDLSQDETFW